MMHILGFHVDMFKSRPSMNVIGYTGSYSDQLYYVVSPKAIAEARNHFGCYDTAVTKVLLLENKMYPSNPLYTHLHIHDSNSTIQDDAKAYSLWEKTIFNNDVMVGRFTSQFTSAISRITLAVMDDLGFYNVTYSPVLTASQKLLSGFSYGKSMGCSFLTSRCEKWSTSRTGYFCEDIDDAADVDTAKSCVFNHISKGVCNAKRSNAEISQQRYWHLSDTSVGTDDEWRDYCPIAKPLTHGDCTDSFSAQNPDTILTTYGEQYSSNSRCFMSSVKRDLYAAKATTARCYVTSCGPYNNTKDGTTDIHLFIKVGDSKWRRCPLTGGAVSDYDHFTGSITCPPVNVICTSGRTANFDTSIALQSDQKTSGGDVRSQIKNIPYWVWIIIGVVVGLVLLTIIIFFTAFLVRKYYGRKWATKKTVDLRTGNKEEMDEVDIEH
jgi:hypothetical protein